jgi:hypothetical protein
MFVIIGTIGAVLFLFFSPRSAREPALRQTDMVELNSISVNPTRDARRVQFTLTVKDTVDSRSSVEIEKAAQKFTEYFLIGLFSSDDRFWANLNPAEPYRIVDSELADTDIGRILLYSDLKLKEDTCELMDPKRSDIGAQYWNLLYARAQELGTNEIPVINRVWIEPDAVEVCERGNRLVILKSRFRVSLEKISSEPDGDSQNPAQKQLQTYATHLVKKLIVPVLTEKINEGASYVYLRQVYQSLILARWYRNKFGFKRDAHFQEARYQVFKDSGRDFSFQPQYVYRRYLDSFKKNTLSFQAENSGVPVMAVMQYFLGGIDIREIRFMERNMTVFPVIDSGPAYVVDFTVPRIENDPPEDFLQYVKNSLRAKPADVIEMSVSHLVGNLPSMLPYGNIKSVFLNSLNTDNIVSNQL